MIESADIIAAENIPSMINILFRGDPLQVTNMIIQFVAVLVVYLRLCLLGYWQKLIRHYRMYTSTNATSIDSKIDYRIAPRINRKL